MASATAREIAASAWCKKTTSGITMDPVLAEAFAEIVDHLLQAKQPEPHEPWLGLATTRELLEELSVRAEVGGYAGYRTVDGD